MRPSAVARALALGTVLWAAAVLPAAARPARPAPPLAPPGGAIVNVSTDAQLQAAVQSLASNTTIVIAPGTYVLSSTLWINGTFTNVGIRGATNNADDVVLVGPGMTQAAYGNVPYGIWTGGNVQGVTIANLTIRGLYYHPIVLNAGTQVPHIYNVHLIDAGQQFIKSNPNGAGGGVNDGIVEYSVIEYATTAKDSYTNGVDVHTGANWIIRNNLFRNIVAPPGQLAGPAVLMWNHSSGTLTEGNTFLNCARGINYGLIVAGTDHSGGIIRNNFFYRSSSQPGDVGIQVADSPNTQVLNNTVFVSGTYGTPIEYRFAGASGVQVINNLTDGIIAARDGATGNEQNNLAGAGSAAFVNAAAGDLHLSATAGAAIDRGLTLANVTDDWDGELRPHGAGTDIGADEFGGTTASYAIGGHVQDPQSAGVPNVTLTLSGSLSRTTTTDASGAFAFTLLPPGDYTLTPLRPGYIFTPGQLTYVGLSANQAAADFSALSAPSAPTGLTALAGAGRITLGWTASPGAVSYIVKRGLVNGGPYAIVASGIMPTAYVDTAVTNGTLYYYVVSAINLAGESANSSQVSASPASFLGVLTASGTGASTSVNLTAEGSADWVHWGSAPNTPIVTDRKNPLAGLLSDYALVGSPVLHSYASDPRPMAWTNGTPTASAAANKNGIWVNGLGNGFTLTAPADTTPRTLVVHVGGWNSGGTLTAHLSDGSAVDFVDAPPLASGQYDRNYTLMDVALGAGTLRITWVMTAGTGNVTLGAAALAGGTAPGPTIAATGGTPQSTVVNTAFGTGLQVTLLNGSSQPLGGVTVTFTSPSGAGVAGVTFGGQATTTAVTNGSGIATTTVPLANGTPGNYTVTATAPGVALPASFALTNTAVAAHGSLAGSITSAATTVNLTTEGSADWVHWGSAPNTPIVTDRKNPLAGLLSDYLLVGSPALHGYASDPRPIAWTNGTPTASAAANKTGIWINGLGNGFIVTAPADSTSRTLVVHVGGWNSGGTFSAHLSDGSAVDFVDTTPVASGQFDRNYTVTYAALGAGQTLKITWVMTSGTGNVTLSAVALSVP